MDNQKLLLQKMMFTLSNSNF